MSPGRAEKSLDFFRLFPLLFCPDGFRNSRITAELANVEYNNEVELLSKRFRADIYNFGWDKAE